MPRLGVAKSAPVRLQAGWTVNVDDYVSALAWSPDGSLLAAATGSGPIRVLDGNGGRPRRELAGHGFGTVDLAWRPASDVLASAGQDGAVRLWDASGGSVELDGGAPWVERLAWKPDGERLASAAGKALRLWDPQGKLVLDLASPETIQDLAWRPSGRTIATAGYGGVRIWRPERPDRDPGHLEWKGASLRVAWSPDAAWIATGDQDATVHFWKTATGDDLMAQGYDTKVRNLSWDASSRFLATAGGTEVLVWDCSGKGPGGTTPRGMEAHRSNVRALAFQPAGSWLASGDGDGRLVVWSPKQGPRTKGEARLDGAIAHVAWRADGRCLAAATAGGTVASVEVVRE